MYKNPICDKRTEEFISFESKLCICTLCITTVSNQSCLPAYGSEHIAMVIAFIRFCYHFSKIVGDGYVVNS